MKIFKSELSGFGLAGYRHLNGNIKLIGGTGRYIADWPEEITFYGNTYTLEEVTKGDIDQITGAIFEAAEYC